MKKFLSDPDQYKKGFTVSNEQTKPVENLDKQVHLLPSKVDPKNTKAAAFTLMQKAKSRLPDKRRIFKS